jgi:hypothetical protein
MPVSIRCRDLIATATASPNQDIECSGDPSLGSLAAKTMLENGWSRGSFLSDELLVAQCVAQNLGECETVDADLIN